MMPNKNLTGYASIDKPWLKYYSEEAKNAKVPECTIYEYLWENNREHLTDIAIIYFGRKITYDQLFEQIDRMAFFFMKNGIGIGDVVTIIAPSVPEIIYSFYAINKIGGISNMIDPRRSPEEIADTLLNTKSKACIILDDLLGNLLGVVEKYVPLILSVAFSDSLPINKKIPMKLLKRENECHSVKALSKVIPKDVEEIACVSYSADQLALLEHTGGTTGVSKAVMLSNENVNAVVEQTKYSGITLNRGESWLAVAFPFTAYALICSQHMPLSLGITINLCFELEMEKVEKQLMKYKCNHMANAPVMWEQLSNSGRLQNADLSFLIAPTVGADKLDVQKEKEINAFLRKHNCNYDIAKGYGMTEIGSGVSVTPSNEINKWGSVGIPLCMTNIGIFDLETEVEMPYGEQGEICICGPSVMMGYYKNQEVSEQVLRKHADGCVWMHSGDIGHMDADGFLYIDGRIKKMIIDYTGFKIFPSLVESVISQMADVEKCCVVGIKDCEHGVGQIPVAFVVLRANADRECVRIRIMELCKAQLPVYSHPRKIVFKDELPYTTAGKVDYRALEKM